MCLYSLQAISYGSSAVSTFFLPVKPEQLTRTCCDCTSFVSPPTSAAVLIIHPCYMSKAWWVASVWPPHGSGAPRGRENHVPEHRELQLDDASHPTHHEIHLGWRRSPLESRDPVHVAAEKFMRQQTDWQQLNNPQYLWVQWSSSG